MWLKAVIEPPSSETSSGSAPASSRACHGRSSSACSTPSVASTATFIPFSSPAMGPGYPAPEQDTHRRTTVSDVPVRSSPVARGPRVGRVLTGLLAGRLVAGPGIEDAVRVAGELVADGRQVALEHVPVEDAEAELSGLIGALHAAGLADRCELTL